MPEKRWKAQERRIARWLHCERVTRIGTRGPDLQSDWLIVEVKDRKVLPAFLVNGLGQARTFAKPGQLGILVLTSPDQDRPLVVMDMHDFREYHI